MDLRTKLIFALVAVSLASMAALGTVAYGVVSSMLEDTYLRYLGAIAESKADNAEKLHRGWQDQVQLITTRTQLRLSLAAWNHQAALDPEAGSREQQRIGRILNDILAVPAVAGLQVHGLDGSLVASAGSPLPAPAAPADSTGPATGRVTLRRVVPRPDAPPLLLLTTPISLEDAVIGSMQVTLLAPDLTELAMDYTGLGDTGEVMLVRRATGGAQLLTPLRDGTPAGTVLNGGPVSPTSLAAAGAERALAGILDHDGAPVFAATRRVATLGWGVVAKVSSSEELELVQSLRSTMMTLGLSISAFAIIAGTALGWWIGRPIHDLADVAQRISNGEHEIRADASGHDEIAMLATAFNQMADELVRCAADPPAADPAATASADKATDRDA